MTKRTYKPFLAVMVSSNPEGPIGAWHEYVKYHIAGNRMRQNDGWVHEIINNLKVAVDSYSEDYWVRVDYYEREEYLIKKDGMVDSRIKEVNRRTIIGPIQGQHGAEVPMTSRASDGDGVTYYTIEMRFPRTSEYPRTEDPNWPALEVGGTSSDHFEPVSANDTVDAEGLVVTEDGEVKLEGEAEKIEVGQTITIFDEFGHPQQMTIQ